MGKQTLKSTSGIILILYLCSLHKAIAQDQLVKKSGETISTIIVEVFPDIIKYRRFDNQNGPVYNIAKAEIFMIKYANGTKDLFGQQEMQSNGAPSMVPPQTQKTPGKTQEHSVENKPEKEKKINRFPRSILSWNPLHLIFGAATIQYEITSKRGKTGFEMPISIAINGTGFSSGFSFKYYPAGQGVIRPFFGPSIEAGYSSNINSVYGKVNGTLLECYPYAGVSFTIGRHFNIGVGTKVGIGFYSGTVEYPDNYNYINGDGNSGKDVSGRYLAYRINLSLGVRF